jgi:toxin ParE1/3/4
VAQNRVIWTEVALADVETIATYIARGSKRYATAVVDRMLETAAALAENAERGRIVPELGDDATREVFVYGWRLIYRVDSGVVSVLTVVHQKQDFQPVASRVERR